jgi:anti-anti-sigma factor
MTARRRKGTATADPLGAGVRAITLIGEFYQRETRDLARELGLALDGDERHLVVDMRGVTFFSAPALRVLVRGALGASKRGVGFALVRPAPDVWEAFELLGLDIQLPNRATLEEALAILPD